jgi:hypothetical protein
VGQCKAPSVVRIGKTNAGGAGLDWLPVVAWVWAEGREYNAFARSFSAKTLVMYGLYYAVPALKDKGVVQSGAQSTSDLVW